MFALQSFYNFFFPPISHSLRLFMYAGDHHRPHADSFHPLSKSYDNHLKPTPEGKGRLRASTGSAPFPPNHPIKTSPPSTNQRSPPSTNQRSPPSTTRRSPTATEAATNATSKKKSPRTNGKRPNDRIRKRASTVLPVAQPLSI